MEAYYTDYTASVAFGRREVKTAYIELSKENDLPPDDPVIAIARDIAQVIIESQGRPEINIRLVANEAVRALERGVWR